MIAGATKLGRDILEGSRSSKLEVETLERFLLSGEEFLKSGLLANAKTPSI